MLSVVAERLALGQKQGLAPVGAVIDVALAALNVQDIERHRVVVIRPAQPGDKAVTLAVGQRQGIVKIELHLAKVNGLAADVVFRIAGFGDCVQSLRYADMVDRQELFAAVDAAPDRPTAIPQVDVVNDHLEQLVGLGHDVELQPAVHGILELVQTQPPAVRVKDERVGETPRSVLGEVLRLQEVVGLLAESAVGPDGDIQEARIVKCQVKCIFAHYLLRSIGIIVRLYLNIGAVVVNLE